MGEQRGLSLSELLSSGTASGVDGWRGVTRVTRGDGDEDRAGARRARLMNTLTSQRPLDTSIS